jgi:hypothetical protein
MEAEEVQLPLVRAVQLVEEHDREKEQCPWEKRGESVSFIAWCLWEVRVRLH